MNLIEREVNEFRKEGSLDIDKSFKIAKKLSVLLRSEVPEEVDLARRLAIFMLDQINVLPSQTQELWADIFEACGFYPYIGKESNYIKLNNLAGQIRKETHRSSYLNGKYLHDEQLRALHIFDTGKDLIISAPTSFGKSLLIEELVARKTIKNIIIIQPTLALLDETRRNLKKYRDFYRLIIKTSQKYSEKGGNIFLFTAERVIEYPEFPKIDLLIIDEFYKLSARRNDDRADNLNVAFYKILKKHNPHFYLLGPNIESVSSSFLTSYNASFFKTNYSLVTADVINLQGKRKLKRSAAEKLLFEVLTDLNQEQTLIYCSSPQRTREMAKKFLQYSKKGQFLKRQNFPLLDWIKDNIHPDWTIRECLSYGIGVHDAALPRHLSASIIHEFNKGKIKYIFCTSTIIEGVNTSAKNVIFFDNTRGKRKIDFFDYSNIKGRAGRLMVHYVGRIFNFHPEPKGEKVNIDLPFFDQPDETSKEILIQIEKEDIKNPGGETYKQLEILGEEERLLFRKNGVSVAGQKQILEQMMIDLKTQPELITWTNYPDWQQLSYALGLGIKYLKKSHDGLGFSLKKATFLVSRYASNPEIMQLVMNEFRYSLENNKKKKSESEILDDAVRAIFHFQRHWLDYTFPKWFHVLNSIQQYACQRIGVKSGDYTYYASSMENDFLEPKLTFLIEMGLPRSAVAKISKVIDSSLKEEEEIIVFLKKNFTNLGLSEYEIQRVNEL